ncbi:putative zinc finger protein [Apostichopus japonicus]|uniref:Putative zinc finger protein n=1 Tax=Stichopus japonicus TaxID=307972 RepID=A0A2G8KMB6_STIJA|nr:putative zinc finger protein [Apostichopus japonicus]
MQAGVRGSSTEPWDLGPVIGWGQGVKDPQKHCGFHCLQKIHLKRQVLDHHSELLLTWWDESKNQQEGLLSVVSVRTTVPLFDKSSASAPTPTTSTNSSSNNCDSIHLGEKLNIHSSPFVSKLLDSSSCSGVALYNDANGLGQPSPTSSTASANQSQVMVIQQRPSIPKVNDLSIRTLSDDNWRSKRPYPCDYCGKPFRTSYEKRRHEMIHTGDRPWKCTECNKAFVDRACLRNHMKKRHLGVKPYKCSFCDILFFDTMNRAKHERTHEERLKAAKQERELLQVKQEPREGAAVSIVQVKAEEEEEEEEEMRTNQLDQENGREEAIVKEESNHPSESNEVEMADVFNITVIPDQSNTHSASEIGKPS